VTDKWKQKLEEFDFAPKGKLAWLLLVLSRW
jgi:hypothetical protein